MTSPNGKKDLCFLKSEISEIEEITIPMTMTAISKVWSWNKCPLLATPKDKIKGIAIQWMAQMAEAAMPAKARLSLKNEDIL